MQKTGIWILQSMEGGVHFFKISVKDLLWGFWINWLKTEQSSEGDILIDGKNELSVESILDFTRNLLRKVNGEKLKLHIDITWLHNPWYLFPSNFKRNKPVSAIITSVSHTDYQSWYLRHIHMLLFPMKHVGKVFAFHSSIIWVLNCLSDNFS